MRRFPVLPLLLIWLGVIVLTLLGSGESQTGDQSPEERASEAKSDAASTPDNTSAEAGAREAPVDEGMVSEAEVDALFNVGQSLWEQFAPEDVKAQYEFPSLDQLRDFLAALETDLAEGSAERLAAYEPDARLALKLLRRFEGGDALADWLQPRLDILKAAVQIENVPLTPPPDTSSGQAEPQTAPIEPPAVRPQYTRAYWDQVLTRRRAPRRAAEFVPSLKEVFRGVGVPPEWVWIAEVESAMNPEAMSPAGARGMFQFMPATAGRFGLEIGLFSDERTDPEKSARAAAEYLRILHRRFQSWPLALAAYNAGEGRVGRALAAAKVSTFEEVAHRLPVETRMYVPKVLATVAAREAVDPEGLPPPGKLTSPNSDVGSSPAGVTIEPRVAETAAPASL